MVSQYIKVGWLKSYMQNGRKREYKVCSCFINLTSVSLPYLSLFKYVFIRHSCGTNKCAKKNSWTSYVDMDGGIPAQIHTRACCLQLECDAIILERRFGILFQTAQYLVIKTTLWPPPHPLQPISLPLCY